MCDHFESVVPWLVSVAATVDHHDGRTERGAASIRPGVLLTMVVLVVLVVAFVSLF